jgi:hypothetical protein
MRGGATVGILSDLDWLEATSIRYLRLWCDGPESQAQVWTELSTALGPDRGREVLRGFEEMCGLCFKFGRRPLMRHGVQCPCVGSDECCFAHFVATAVEGEREDALMFAMLLVRPDMAPLLAALASDFGLALRRLRLANARTAPSPSPEAARVLH